MSRTTLLAVSAAIALSAALTITGCSESTVVFRQEVANADACGGEECHDAAVTAAGAGPHASLECVVCHEGTGDAHAEDPKTSVGAIDWTIDACSTCHEGEARTYLYDDNAKPGPFGGSQRTPPQPKDDVFPKYDTIVAGHAFARDYNEEGAHKYMVQDHYEILRGKFETCVQCKSTKVAYSWLYGKPITVAEDQEIELTHTATGTVPAKRVNIPKGTTLVFSTDPVTRQVDAKATMPDGTVYRSIPEASEDATQSNNMLWASTIAAIKDTWPYGAGCNHCHDPHSAKARVVRQAMIQSIENTGGPDGAGGTNPYLEGSPKSFDKASDKDKEILSCAQCHVEYTCGKSGIDKVDRDAYGWTKASDLHDVYDAQFGYAQDWKHAIIGQPLIKNQHPETELYWSSVHYNAGASCSDCHMPELIDGNGRSFRSHWLTSPYKYGDAKLFAAFAEGTGINGKHTNDPCEACHENRTARGIGQQQAFYAKQGEVEKLLAESVGRLGGIAQARSRGAKVDQNTYDEALEAHRRAHAVWENLAVSENSMGFHNFDEAMTSMEQARADAVKAIAAEKKLAGGK